MGDVVVVSEEQAFELLRGVLTKGGHKVPEDAIRARVARWEWDAMPLDKYAVIDWLSAQGDELVEDYPLTP